MKTLVVSLLIGIILFIGGFPKIQGTSITTAYKLREKVPVQGNDKEAKVFYN